MPRALGYLGKGPWPLSTRTVATPGLGIGEAAIVGASTDEAQNLWVATTQALYLLKPGDPVFRRYAAADGLNIANAGSPGITNLAGGAANQVFVGYEGVWTTNPTNTDPERHRGKFDFVTLNPNGTLTVRFIDAHNANSSVYWENRSVRRFAYDHFTHPGTLYIAFSHGVDIMFPALYQPLAAGQNQDAWYRTFLGDHVHPRSCYHAACNPNSNSNLRLGEFRGLALDASGSLWMGGRYAAARIHWQSNPQLWIKSWKPYNAFDPSYGDPYPSNAPIFQPPLEGDAVSISATAVGADGRVYFASDGTFDSSHPAYGLAILDLSSHAIVRPDPVALGFGTRAISDLAALPDGRILVAAQGHGLWAWNPNTGAKQQLTTAAVKRLWVDTMVSPPAVYAATASGLWIGRGL